MPLYVGVNCYLQYKTVKYICLEDLMTPKVLCPTKSGLSPSKNDDNTLWLNFF